MIGARPSIGSSSSSRLGIHHQRARDREHLLLAAGELVAEVAPPLLEAREDARRRAPRSTWPGRATAVRCSSTVSDGQHVALLRHPAEPALRAPVRRQRGEVAPAPAERAAMQARRGPSASRAAWSCRRRCGRAARGCRPPRSASDTSSSTTDVAVAGGHALEREQLSHAAPRPDRPRCTRGSAAISAGVPSVRHRAADQHRDALGEAEHEVHVVLDEQDRDVARQLRDDAEELGALAGGNAGGGLVEQQDRAAASRAPARSRPGAACRRRRLRVSVSASRVEAQRASSASASSISRALLRDGAVPDAPPRPRARRSRARPTPAP